MFRQDILSFSVFREARFSVHGLGGKSRDHTEGEENDGGQERLHWKFDDHDQGASLALAELTFRLCCLTQGNFEASLEARPGFFFLFHTPKR